MINRLAAFAIGMTVALLAPPIARAQTPPPPPAAQIVTPPPAAQIVTPPPAAQIVTPPAATAAAAPAACAAPGDLLSIDIKLPHVAAALKAGKDLDILAVGSATMLGPRGGTEGSFPYRMAQTLRTAVPGANIRLTVHSGRGLTAADMLSTITAELGRHPYQLVLWQTATVEAVRNLPPDDFLQTLSEGARRAQAAHADLILIDPQFSRFLHANANLDPYQQTLQQATGLPGVALFHRFDLMRHWVSAGQIDLERAGRSERQKTADLLHECLGRALAHVILQGADIPAP
jgi:hypothetical protein